MAEKTNAFKNWAYIVLGLIMVVTGIVLICVGNNPSRATLLVIGGLFTFCMKDVESIRQVATDKGVKYWYKKVWASIVFTMAPMCLAVFIGNTVDSWRDLLCIVPAMALVGFVFGTFDYFGYMKIDK